MRFSTSATFSKIWKATTTVTTIMATAITAMNAPPPLLKAEASVSNFSPANRLAAHMSPRHP